MKGKGNIMYPLQEISVPWILCSKFYHWALKYYLIARPLLELFGNFSIIVF